MVIYFILLIINTVLYYCAPDYPSRAFIGICLILSIVSIVYFFCDRRVYKYKELSGIYLRHSNVFLIGFIVVFYQYALDFSLGLIDVDSKILEYVWYDVTVVSKAVPLSNIALLTFFMGNKAYKKKLREPRFYYVINGKKIMTLIGLSMLAFYLLLSGFAADPTQDSNRGILVLVQAVFLSIIAAYCYELKDKNYSLKIMKKELLFPVILMLLYIIIVLATGKRGGVIKIAFLLLIAYLYLYRRKVPYIKIAIAGFVSIGILAIVGVTRTTDISVSEGIDILKENKTISPVTIEHAGSVNTLHIALSHYPQKIEYNLGSTFFSGFSLLVPGLSRLISFLNPNIIGSEETITLLYFDGALPDWSWGLGTSIIADVFISFGIIGVIIIFSILGYFVKYLEVGTFCNKRSPYFLALSFCVYSQLYLVSRGPVFILFLSLSYALLLLLITTKKKPIITDTNRL